MKKLIVFGSILSFFLCGCNNESKLGGVDGCELVEPEFIRERNDSLARLEQEQDSIDTVEEYVASDAIQRLLEDPLDLAAYKKEYGPSNSGVYDIEEDVYLPEEEGFYYRYMLFQKLGKHFGEGVPEARQFSGFDVIVYQFGTEVGDFYDTDEVLIGINSKLHNPTLGKLNVIHRSPEQVVEEFGTPFIEKTDHFVYVHEDRIWSIRFESGMAAEFQYRRLDHEVKEIAELPKWILE